MLGGGSQPPRRSRPASEVLILPWIVRLAPTFRKGCHTTSTGHQFPHDPQAGQSMKILVSTAETNGQRESDFCFVPEGERLYRGPICARDRNDPNPDGGCGCGRALNGVLCHKGTTTFKVVDDPEMDDHRFVAMFQGAMQDSQVGQLLGQKETQAYARQTALEIRDALFGCKSGDILELRSGKLRLRKTNES